jgi:hypothetical protein
MDEAYSAAYLPPRLERGEPRPPQGASWIIYAGMVLGIAGVVNAIYGLAAVTSSDFFEHHADYVAGNLEAWGWVALIAGIVQLSASFAIWRGAPWGRGVGIGSAGINAIVQLTWLPAQPLAAVAIYALDMLVLYGLLRYGNVQPGPVDIGDDASRR